jgi:FlaA1/EpsC-like NDP-sugar epimerase
MSTHDTVKPLMVIGAGGSLGRHVCGLFVEEGRPVIALDVCENRLAHVRRCYGARPHLISLEDTDLIMSIVEKNDVDTVVNCAAMKHLESCEKYIEDAIEVNILSNHRLMSRLKEQDRQFVFVSSDKAIQPKNVYALTKQFTDHLALRDGFKIVRGVNFFNSEGSVINIWETQRLLKRPFTVVTNSAKRYFIGLYEMAQLVATAVKESPQPKVYTPGHVYLMEIQDLFRGFLKASNLKLASVEVEMFEMSKVEKEMEELDFEPGITEVTSIDQISVMIQRSLHGHASLSE